MHRRTYLGALASGVGLFGGCLGGGSGASDRTATATVTDDVTPAPTATETPEPTETETITETETATETESAQETPDPGRPRIERASLVWEQSGPDSVRDNRIDAAGAGSRLLVGFEYRLEMEAGEFDPLAKVRILEDGRRQIDTEEHGFEWELDEARDGTYPFWLPVDSTGYGTGTYEAVVTLENRGQGLTSEPARFSFDLVEPLAPTAVELRHTEPQSATVGEPFDMALTFRNRADRTSSLVRTVVAQYQDDGDRRHLSETSIHLPALSTVTHTYEGMKLPEPGRYEFSLADTDISWSLEVRE